MEKIGFGVIGAGIWGNSHAWIYSTEPYSELIAVCDKVERKLKFWVEKYHARCWQNRSRKMLKDPEIQAVGIATPDFVPSRTFVCCRYR